MQRRRNIRAAVAAAIGLTMTAGLAALTVVPAAGSDGRAAAWRHVSWIASGPPLTISTPICDPTGHCVYPWTESGTDAGDLQGTHAAAGGATADATGHSFGTNRISVFTGSVRGCGHGTVTMAVSAVTHPDGTTSERWSIRGGFGAGDLSQVSGSGSGVLAAQSTDAHYTGFVRCHS